MQQIQFKISHSEAKKILVRGTPVKKEEKLHHENDLKQNICALDMIGLSWIFQEDDLF